MFRMSAEGLQRQVDRINAMPDALVKAAATKLNEEAEGFADELKAITAKHSGALAATVRVEPGRNALSVNVIIGDKTHNYAPAIEFGHFDYGVVRPLQSKVRSEGKGRHIPARPWIYPLWRLRKPKIRAALTRFVNAFLKSGGLNSSDE